MINIAFSCFVTDSFLLNEIGGKPPRSSHAASMRVYPKEKLGKVSMFVNKLSERRTPKFKKRGKNDTKRTQTLFDNRTPQRR